MANDPTVTLHLQGDSEDLERANNEAAQSTQQMARQIGSSEEAFQSASREASRFGEALDKASGGVSMLSGGIGDIGGSMTAFADLQKLGKERAFEQQQALLDVEQAQKDYNEAVKEFGEGSLEARQAQLALNMAQEAAKPPTDVQQWGEKLELISPIIMGLVGVIDLMILANTALQASWLRTTASMVASKVAMAATTSATYVATAAQWLWNAAMTANPIGLIIVAIAALVGAIIWVATQTDWFQKAWTASWDWIKKAAENTWNFIKQIPGWIGSAFSTIASAITWPFRTAFNFIADAWNNTIGRLSWTVPGWVPVIGGHNVSVPKIPKFHQGGKVPGAPGTETMAILQAGEVVKPANAVNDTPRTIYVDLGPALMDIIQREVGARGGDVQLVLGGSRG